MTATSIGREIVKQEQWGKRAAGYGERLITSLSAQITREFGSGYSVNNLEHFRNFYITYPNLVTTPISHAPRGELLITEKPDHSGSTLGFPKSCFRLRTIVETACAYLPPTMNKTSQKLQQAVIHRKRSAATALHESKNRWFGSKPAERGLKQRRGKMSSRKLLELRKNIIGPRVRQARLRSRPRLTQQQLANRVASMGANIDRAGIAKIEIGLRCVCDFEVLVLAKALNVSISCLLSWRRMVPR